MYLTPRFMEQARSYLERAVSDDAIDEAERLAAEVGSKLVAVACPVCGADTEFSLGHAVGSSAIPRCKSCDARFHAHRGRLGEAFASGAVFRFFRCSRCDAHFRESSPAAGADRITRKKCFRCSAKLALNWDTGQATLVGEATVCEGTQVSPKTMACSGCGNEVVIVYRDSENRLFGTCLRCDAIVRGSVG
jgi:transposase-like protein